MSDKQNNLIAGLSLLSGIPTIISVLVVLGLYWRYKSLQVIEFKMIIYMLTGDLIITTDMVIISIWYQSILITRYFFLPDPANNNTQAVCPITCQILAVLKVFGGMLSFVWTFNISYVLKQTLYDKDFSLKQIWVRLQIKSLAVVLIFSVIPFFGNAYGVVVPYLRNVNCFIKYGSPKYGSQYTVDDFMEIACFYGPLWIICAYCLYAQCKIEKKLIIYYNNAVYRKRIQHLKFYPLVLMICYLWISIYRIFVMAGINIRQIETVIYFFQNSNGFLNCLVYTYYTLFATVVRRTSNSSASTQSERNIEYSQFVEEKPKNTELGETYNSLSDILIGSSYNSHNTLAINSHRGSI